MVFSEYMPSSGIVGSCALGIEMETRWIHILVFRKYYPEESLEKMSKILSDILNLHIEVQFFCAQCFLLGSRSANMPKAFGTPLFFHGD